MSKYLIIILIILTGCKYCEWGVPTHKQEQHIDLFLKCLDKASEARKGLNYTTNDDEDFDEVILECRLSSKYILQERICMEL